MIRGKAGTFDDQGGEGHVDWVVFEDGVRGYDAVHVIEKGDRLKLTDKDGSVVFDGVIDPVHPVCKNRWTDEEYKSSIWHQRGWALADWYGLFCDFDKRAELEKAEE